MRAIMRSIIKNPFKNTVYILLLLTAFIPMNLFINTYLMGRKLSGEYAARIASGTLLDIIWSAIIIIFLCAVNLPFVQYLFAMGLGYEIGVMRALGMGKTRAWARMFLENVLLLAFAFILAGCVTLAIHRRFALTLLVIDGKTDLALFARLGLLGFNWQTMYITLCLAVIMTLFTSMVCNALISNSAPLKLIRKSK